LRHEVLSEDPDLIQAIADLTPIAHKLRLESARLLNTPEDGPQRRMVQENVRDLYHRIALRASRIGTTGEALVEILNATLDSKARRGRVAPAGDTSRNLLTSFANAVSREEAAHTAVTAAQEEVRAATKHRKAVLEACRAFGIQRIAR
jgi:hypothetical protein